MSKFTAMIHHAGIQGSSIAVPGRSVTELAKELEAARLSGSGYEIYDGDPTNTGVAMYLPSWQLQNIIILTRVDMEQVRKAQEKAAIQDKIRIAPPQ